MRKLHRKVGSAGVQRVRAIGKPASFQQAGRDHQPRLPCCRAIEQDVELNKNFADDDSADFLGQLQVQGRNMASEVARLRQVANERASTLEELQALKAEQDDSTAQMQQDLDEKEEEVEVLRLQAQRAALLEIESEIQQKLIADLRAFCELQSTEVRDVQSRFSEFESVLGAALEEVEHRQSEAESQQQRDGELAELRKQIGLQHAQLKGLSEQLEASRSSCVMSSKAAELARSECSQAEERYTKLSVKFNALQRNYSNAKRSNKPRGKGFDPRQAELHKAQSEVASLQKALESMQQEVESGKSEVMSARRARDDAMAEAVVAQQKLQQKMQALTEEVQAKEREAQKEVEMLKRELEEARNSDLHESLEKAQAEAAQLRSEIEIREKESKAAEAQLEALRDELREKGKALDAAKRASTELRTALKTHMEELERTKKELAKSQNTVEEQAGVIQTLRSEVDAASETVAEKDAEIDALHGKVMTVRTHALKLEEALRHAQNGTASDGEVKQLEDRLNEAREEYDDVSEDLQRVSQELAEARRREEDRVSELANMRGALEAERGSKQAMEQALMDVREKSAALQKELNAKGARLTEVERQLNEGGVIVRQRELEIRSLRNELDRLKAREDGWTAELQDAGLVTQQLTQKLQALEEALESKDQQLANAREEAARASEMAQEANQSAVEASELMAKLDNLDAQLEAREAEVQQERELRVELEGQVGSLANAFAALEQRYEQQAADVTNAESLRKELLQEARTTRQLLTKAEELARAIMPMPAHADSAPTHELHRLREELSRQQQAVEDATTAARAAEDEAEELREALRGQPGQEAWHANANAAHLMNNHEQDEFVKRAAKAATAEAEWLKSENEVLRESIKDLENQLLARRDINSGGLVPQRGERGGEHRQSHQGEDSKSMQAIQDQNKELRDKAMRASKLLKQSRKFIDQYLDKSDSMLQTVGISKEELRMRTGR